MKILPGAKRERNLSSSSFSVSFRILSVSLQYIQTLKNLNKPLGSSKSQYPAAPPPPRTPSSPYFLRVCL